MLTSKKNNHQVLIQKNKIKNKIISVRISLKAN